MAFSNESAHIKIGHVEMEPVIEYFTIDHVVETQNCSQNNSSSYENYSIFP